MTRAVEILKQTRDILTDPDAWTCEGSQDILGHKCHWNSPSVYRSSAVDTIRRIGGLNVDSAEAFLLYRKAIGAGPFLSVELFEKVADHDVILGVLDRAIDRAKPKTLVNRIFRKSA